MLGQAGAVSSVVVWQHHVGAQTARSLTENKQSQNNLAEITVFGSAHGMNKAGAARGDREHPPGTAPTSPSRAPRAPRELLQR